MAGSCLTAARGVADCPRMCLKALSKTTPTSQRVAAPYLQRSALCHPLVVFVFTLLLFVCSVLVDTNNTEGHDASILRAKVATVR
jgi:hypothetical protein